MSLTDRIGWTFEFGYEWDLEADETVEKVPYDILEEIEIRTVEPVTNEEDWAVGFICENPFYDQHDWVEENIDLLYSSWIEDYKHIYADLKDHHPKDEVHDYEVRRCRIRNLEEIEIGGVSTLDIHMDINW